MVYSNVNDLRKFRNEDFAHIPQGQLSDPDFKVVVQKLENAFKALGFSTVEMQTINTKAFQTDEVKKLMDEVQNLNQELQTKDAKLYTSEEQRQVLEQQLDNKVESFCVLPPKPSQQVAGRGHEVAKIEKELDNLRKANENSLSYCYISGNPGCGKSQLAGLVAKRFYDEAISGPSDPSFVMTLNAEKLGSAFGIIRITGKKSELSRIYGYQHPQVQEYGD